MSKTIHIVSFDYPYPPNYGGIIDVYYKLKTLRQAGVNIILHYFADKKQDSEVINTLCEQVYFYPKKPVINSGVFSDLPLRMVLRSNKSILNNLLKDDFPVFFEGLHSSFISTCPELHGRRMFLRCHNAEAEYAANMANTETNFVKRKTFEIEAKRTAKFEKKLHHFTGLFVLTEKDKAYFENTNENVKLLPIFHQDNGVEEPDNLGNYILFHGNLSVNENIQTAKWIVNEIAPQFWDFNFIIAGKDPDASFVRECDQQNVTCIANPSQQKMDDLIRDSQIILLKTAVPSGIKLKLVDSLAKGRHIISDENTVVSSGLEKLVHIANHNDEVIKEIRLHMHEAVDPTQIYERNVVFNQLLNNDKNANWLINEIFEK
ncbi:MAG: hypothetical protein Q4G27_07845 [Flavobacteriaceae bacterium]|nr:hypothetical protein [Flavobacteriaceae bacterium]